MPVLTLIIYVFNFRTLKNFITSVLILLWCVIVVEQCYFYQFSICMKLNRVVKKCHTCVIKLCKNYMDEIK